MVFGGVEIGRINANDAAIPQGNSRRIGCIFATTACD